ncbi:MAG TPA: hypothetical protein VE131_13710 [Terriglobales bacterium]|nr:hypothetical protein [Terriglobales bacterium]
MDGSTVSGRPSAALKIASAVLVMFLSACAVGRRPAIEHDERLRRTAALVAEVKAFGKTLGIEPTEALRQTTQQRPANSMLWFWLQRKGTLALDAAIDIRLTVGFSIIKEKLGLDRVYPLDGYSVYFRQGNEFADGRSVATVGFADEDPVRKVNIIFHEDLHGDANFALPWETEESIVTPLGSLAAVNFFAHKGDDKNLRRAQDLIEENRQLCRELNGLAKEAQRFFARGPLEQARAEVLALMDKYPTYRRHFRHEIAGQNPLTALEAKLSHDLAYFRYFDAIVELSEKAPDLQALIADLKRLPATAGIMGLEAYLVALNRKYALLPQ